MGTKDWNNINLFINKIKKNEILLPDFQRGFVWEVEDQKRLVASVLAGLPIGSLLLLEAKSQEFKSKLIGRKDVNNAIESCDQKKYYLLDGQQRLTTLVNVFSNVIFEDLKNWNSLLSPSLKHRFFMKFSNLRDKYIKGDDLFGLQNFTFPFDPKLEEPMFSTSDILGYIVTRSYNKEDASYLHPKRNFSDIMDHANIKNECHDQKNNSYYIPLFLLTQKDLSCFKKIIDMMVKEREEYLCDLWKKGDESGDFSELIELMPGTEKYIKNKINCLEFIKGEKENWKDKFINYLIHCIEEMKINTMSISYSDRGKAIDIYENLNKGGISLNNFDLIIAKAAIAEKDFYNDFKKEIMENVEIPTILAQTNTLNAKWNSVENMNVIGNRDNISKTYLNVFLNLLSIISYHGHKLYDESITSPEILSCMKKNKILDISAQQISENYRNVVKALNRALAFLQFRCGLISISELPYDHLLLGLSYILYDENQLNNLRTLNILEGWYLSSIFSKTYDQDQNQRISIDLKELDNLINYNGDHRFLDERKEQVFNANNFTDLDTLLMKNDDVLPKSAIKKGILNYILSKNPSDFIEKNKILTAYGISKSSKNGGDKLETHHIIPLKNTQTLRESTRRLRNEKNSIYNSPLNYTYILSVSNNRISCLDAEAYLRKIDGEILVSHLIPQNALESAGDIEKFLKERYETIKCNMKNHLNQILAFNDTGE